MSTDAALLNTAWEREYEEDRRRAQAGEQIVVLPGRAPRKGRCTGESTILSPDPPSALRHSSLDPFSARVEVPSMCPVKSLKTSEGVDSLRYTPVGAALQRLFGDKFHRGACFSEVVSMRLRGTFFTRLRQVVCVVTPHGMYLGDLSNGSVFLFVNLRSLLELFVFEGCAVGLRTSDGVDYYLRCGEHTARLVGVVKAAATRWCVTFHTHECDESRERQFIREMVPVSASQCVYRLVEDPRTGLELVRVPSSLTSAPHLSALAPYLVHWCGEVEHVTLNSEDQLSRTARVAWVTPTCLFLSDTNEVAGERARRLRRCVGVEYLTDLLDGPSNEVGLWAKRGPPQPLLVLRFSSPEEKETVLSVLVSVFCYRCQARPPLRVTKVDHIPTLVGLEDERDFVPFTFRMREYEELYRYLRLPTQP